MHNLCVQMLTFPFQADSQLTDRICVKVITNTFWHWKEDRLKLTYFVFNCQYCLNNLNVKWWYCCHVKKHFIWFVFFLGDVIKDMGHYIFHHSNVGNTEYSGFFFLKPTFQCLNKIPLPEQPYMFGILIQKYELPWARVFPLRLMLRLGAEYKC